MSETTITAISTSIHKGLLYANGEMAWFSEGEIASSVFNSSAISYWSYNPSSMELSVQYGSGGIYYYYEQVPYSVIFDMMFADSLGAFIAKSVKPIYSVA